MSKLLIRHTIFWLCTYLIWAYLKSSGRLNADIMLATILNLIVYMIVFYLLRFSILPFVDRKPSMLKLTGCFITLFAFVYLLWKLIGVLNVMDVYADAFLLETVQSFVPAMALLAIEMHVEQRKEYDRMQIVERDKIAGELRLLKAQINPQFLLDTLNNLSDKVMKKSPEAPEMIMRLSDVLDHVLYKSQKDVVSLHEELQSIESFITLEKIRYNGNLHVDFEYPGYSNLQIAPLILLDLVQNVFRIIGKNESPVEIKMSICESFKSLDFKINCSFNERVDIVEEREIESIARIKRQLNLVYPDRHELLVKRIENSIDIRLHIITNQ